MSQSEIAKGEPFLQILHISDVHFIWKGLGLWPDWNARPWCKLETKAQIGNASPLDRLLRGIYEFVKDGVASHDPSALKALYRYLERGGHRHDEWRDTTTWLVHGGDLTTFADDRSLRSSLDYLRALRSFVEKLITIHGNHDVWPEKLPYLDPGGIPGKAAAVPALFASESDTLPLGIDIPGIAARLELHTLDTVHADYADNTLAVGRVSTAELDRIRAVPAAPDRFRVLLVHHPLSDPSGRFYKRTIFEDKRVAAALLEKGKPRFHLVIAGHTHDLHPGLGNLPANSKMAKHHPLSVDQAQLVVGSAAQHDEFRNRQPFDHQAQLLRFRVAADGAGRPVVAVERVLVARRRGFGPFQHIESSDLTATPVQAVAYALS